MDTFVDVANIIESVTQELKSLTKSNQGLHNTSNKISTYKRNDSKG